MATNREKLAQLKSTSGNRPKIKEFPKPQGRDLDGWWVQIDEWRKALMLEVAQLVTEALPLPPVTQTPPGGTGGTGTGGGTTPGTGSPFDASYVVLSLNDVLSKERALIGTVNQIDLDDLGPNNNVRLYLPQDIALTSTPTFDSLILQGPDADLTLGTSGTIADNAGVMSLFPITTVLIDSHTTINGMIRLDGDDNTHPALRSNGAVLEVVLADNSTLGDLRANELFLVQPLKSEYGGTGIAGTVQGALLFGSALNTYSLLSKDTNATRYLANTGTSNNPKWDFVNLTNGVTGELPLTNFPTISEYSVLGVAGGSAAQPAAIGPASNFQVLRRNGTTLGFGAVDISSGTAVTNVMRTVNGGTGLSTYTQGDLIYASTTGLGAVISLLAKDANATRYLSNTGGSNNPAWAQVNLANGVTGDLLYANLTPASAASLLFGRGSAAGAGDWQEITLGAGLTMTGTVLSSSGGGASPPFDDQATALVKGSADATKLLRFEVDGFTTATTRVLTPQDADYIIAGTNIFNSFSVQQTFNEDAGILIGSMALTDPGALGTLVIDNGSVQISNGRLGVSTTPHASRLLTIGGAGQIHDNIELTIYPTTTLLVEGKTVINQSLVVYGGFTTVALSPAQITADQNDYNVGNSSFIRLSSDASRTITGIDQGSNGKHLILVNTGAFNIVLANQSVASLAANRFITGTGADITLAPDERVAATYDATTGRWRFGAKVYSGGGVGTHALLSATHSDTLAAGVSRGSLIVGNATPAWTELVVGAANRVLFSDGSDAAWSASPTLSDLTLLLSLNTQATSPAQITANQNDYAIGGGTFFRLSSDAARTITGLTGGVNGKRLTIVNVGFFNITFANESASSTAANRIITGYGQGLVVAPDELIEMVYDVTTQRWRCQGHWVFQVGDAGNIVFQGTASSNRFIQDADLVFTTSNNRLKLGVSTSTAALMIGPTACASASAPTAGAMIDGKVAISTNGSLPTAYLYLGGSVTGATNEAAIKFTAAGSLLGTPENGGMEYDGADLYQTISGTRYKIGMVSAGAARIASGTYTPTLTNVANLDASTAYQCQYLRVGDTVTVSGKVDVDPTTTLISTQLGISLPIASNIGAVEDCAGCAAASGIAGQSAAIIGDAANDRALMQWVAADVTNQGMFFTFTYQVI